MKNWKKSHLPGSALWLPVVMLVALACGCKMTEPVAELNPFVKAETGPEYQQPVRMAVIWKESTVSAPGKPATRGFGGRVYFYNEENETIRVDGELSVYAYDDTHSVGQETRAPDRKYVFRAADLQRHYGETGLGDSYNIWLPWDRVGGERKTISLVPIFKPVDGLIPQSDHSIAILSGTTSGTEREFNQQVGKTDALVQQVSMTVPAGASKDYATQLGAIQPEPEVAENAPTVRTTTFELPRATANRMKLARMSNQRQRMAQEEQSRSGKEASASSNVATTQVLTPQATRQSVPESPAKSRAASKVFGQPGTFR